MLVDDLATTRRLRQGVLDVEEAGKEDGGERRFPPSQIFASSYVWRSVARFRATDSLQATRVAAISASKLFECFIFVVIFLNVIALSTELSLNDDASSNDVPLDVLR